ncbi:uncharacterized protein LOC110602475 [Manihot esculenta]|uniref:DUF761 domain-containing protein n=1 Tax=Manihot esculenta TaxID=3983 RepID=A0A2C9UCM0_MANES|nr:uncharacterized protein LOC110602475 [Manihot esculenta]OAY28098.1 hypothetical protein MANES_15G040900v8 [Manihot esculenta]
MTTKASAALEILSLSISKKENKILMSYSGLEKKLQPAKKAWKRFAKTIETKFRNNLNFSSAIKVIKTSSNRLCCSLRSYRPFRKHSTIRRPYRGYHYNNSNLYRHHYSSKNQVRKNFSPIYIDNLYSVESPRSSSSLEAKHSHAETSSRGEQVVDKHVLPRKVETEKEKKKEKVLYSIEDAWREVVAKSPQLRPVDERAEEFIANFRREIKLQREKSIGEFEEMLARGA